MLCMRTAAKTARSEFAAIACVPERGARMNEASADSTPPFVRTQTTNREQQIAKRAYALQASSTPRRQLREGVHPQRVKLIQLSSVA